MQRNETPRASPKAVQTARYTPYPSTQKKKVTVALQGESIVKAQLLNLIAPHISDIQFNSDVGWGSGCHAGCDNESPLSPFPVPP